MNSKDNKGVTLEKCNSKKAVFFDFDGVLIDTFEVSLEVCRLFDPDLTSEDFKEHHNFPWDEASKIDIDEEKVERFFEEKGKRVEMDQLFPIKKIIEELNEENELFIISNSSEKNIKEVLSEADLLQFFEDISGGERRISKSERIRELINKNRITSEDCVLVTDTLGDIKEGKRVGVETVAVSWGFHDIETLEKGDPDAIVESMEDLPEYLEIYSS